VQRTNRKIQFHDEEVDKYWIAGLSPYIVLKGTRSDQGPWDKITDDDAKAEWDALPQEKKDEYGYEYELMRILEQLCSEMDRLIKRTREKVDNEKPVQLGKESQAQVDAYMAQIKELQAKAQTLGDEGDIDGSMKANTVRPAAPSPFAARRSRRWAMCAGIPPTAPPAASTALTRGRGLQEAEEVTKKKDAILKPSYGGKEKVWRTAPGARRAAHGAEGLVRAGRRPSRYARCAAT